MKSIDCVLISDAGNPSGTFILMRLNVCLLIIMNIRENLMIDFYKFYIIHQCSLQVKNYIVL